MRGIRQVGISLTFMLVKNVGSPAGTRLLDADGGHDVGEAGAVVDVATGEHERQDPTGAVTGEVDLGQSTSTSTEGVILWFVRFPAPP